MHYPVLMKHEVAISGKIKCPDWCFGDTVFPLYSVIKAGYPARVNNLAAINA